MKKDLNKEFLDAFFKMLNEVIISYGQFDRIVFGIVTGISSDIEELCEHQNFLWRIDKSNQELCELIELCEFISINKLINGDKVLISENQLIELLVEIGWSTEKSQKVIDDLFSFEIRMVDDGEETDSFFVHF